ncbi:YhbY family RNA-binding protein [Sansalvadorimonas sp. 2012CJ34-2]|uniref:YhbY family RNA-binding protein n=1 Tax=Parendozoicomonas callyspongiae TaxID=2942213 RepID=A0ABT0PF23_9GAMM|nr:YhbY family RNA-binding protein [Sansalvadorimonas sp. 2012CJ34-2]MCL6269989.1 YhbY family RNA-binding protein [Sansalvadorimonas sp. 2012CJ34-2]
MALNAEKKRELRAIGHKLKPVVIVSENGITEGVVEETLRALGDHELIKVKFAVLDREAKKQLMAELCEACGADLIQTIGKIALILKPAKEPNPRLSNLLRVL